VSRRDLARSPPPCCLRSCVSVLSSSRLGGAATTRSNSMTSSEARGPTTPGRPRTRQRERRVGRVRHVENRLRRPPRRLLSPVHSGERTWYTSVNCTIVVLGMIDTDSPRCMKTPPRHDSLPNHLVDSLTIAISALYARSGHADRRLLTRPVSAPGLWPAEVRREHGPAQDPATPTTPRHHVRQNGPPRDRRREPDRPRALLGFRPRERLANSRRRPNGGWRVGHRDKKIPE